MTLDYSRKHSSITLAWVYTDDMKQRCKVFETLPDTDDEKLEYLNTDCCVRVEDIRKNEPGTIWYNHYLMWYDKKFYYKYRILFKNTRM